MAEDSYPVVLYVYDLSQGLARQLSTTLLGTVIDGIWHTSVQVYGLEYCYSGGIVKYNPLQTPYGKPVRVIELGTTQVPRDFFEEFLTEISPRFTAETYNLLKHNCNNFSNEVTQFLLGVDIPEYILQLPNIVMSSPMGALILPMIEQMETSLRYGGVPQVPQAAATLPAPVLATALRSSSKGESSGAPEKADPVEAVVSPSKKKKNDARAKVQEEISREFAALMAAGGLRASEAAAMAARRVMQRHGLGGGGVTSTQS